MNIWRLFALVGKIWVRGWRNATLTITIFENVNIILGTPFIILLLFFPLHIPSNSIKRCIRHNQNYKISVQSENNCDFNSISSSFLSDNEFVSYIFCDELDSIRCLSFIFSDLVHTVMNIKESENMEGSVPLKIQQRISYLVEWNEENSSIIM